MVKQMPIAAGIATPALSDDHKPQLDGLRVLAVAGVINAHYLGWSHWLHTGGMGVQLFFVLSGFLITGILLQVKARCADANTSRLAGLKVFYIRRMLRIFPLYYAVLIVALIVFSDVRPLWAWHLTYTSNIYVILENQWLGRMGAFWSLCVEEQFYLVWPWLVLWLPMRGLVTVIGVMLAVGPLTRALVIVSPVDWSVFTTANVDALGAGALLAVLRSRPSGFPARAMAALATRCMVVGLALLCFLQVARDLWAWRTIYTIGFNSALSVLFFGVVSKASSGFQGFPGKLLASRPMVYIGKISYGIYVYHGFVPYLVVPLLKLCGANFTFLRVPLCCLVLLGVASASWRYFENPINRLKERFSYVEG